MSSLSTPMSIIGTILFFFFHSSVVLAVSTTTNNSIQCSTLQRLLPNQVSYPSSITYISSVLSYFFVQERLSPACIVQPKSTQDVSTIVSVLSEIYDTQPNATLFSIRSGGHTPFAGAANSDGGVTIDLTLMDILSLSGDNSTVSVGAGSIWSNIYTQLDPMDLTVLGGRVAGIGVGGLLTGGGVSFLSPEHGWACDGIIGMEVVLANGSAIYASSSSHSDLFTALKGGSNNFGIVTRFDLKTFKQGNLFGGFVFYEASTVPQQLEAFNTFMDPANFDPHASIIQAFGYHLDGHVAIMGMEYTLPVANVIPIALQPFLDIGSQFWNTMRVSSLLDFVLEEGSVQAQNSRGMYITTVFSPTLSILTSIYDLWNATTPSFSSVAGIGYDLIYQRLPATIPNNTNSFNLPSSAQNLVLGLLSITWDNELDDELVNSVTTALMGAIEEQTKEAGVYNSFKYLNYATPWQKPLASYGEEGKANLLHVAQIYDPRGLFQKGVPGGFKLSSLDL